VSSLVGLRRKTQRIICSVAARIIVPGSQSVDCTIRDVTTDGAKLALDARISVNDRVFLLIPSIAEVWAAEIRWRRGQEVGVRFFRGEADLPAANGSDESASLAMRLQSAHLARNYAQAKRPAS
jgi:hypothetical protein